MVRISRLTDYGIVLLTHMASHPERMYTASEAAAEAHLPLPTVSKLLRRLAKQRLLASHRGVKGGYGLARPPEEMTVASVVAALEGPIAITTCSGSTPSDCQHEGRCPVRTHWNLINLAVRQALDSITLADLAGPPRQMVVPMLGVPQLGGEAR
ncbi:MAG: SUF system Fe-S cluster assembly regulator [Candidatus Binatia bacterium]